MSGGGRGATQARQQIAQFLSREDGPGSVVRGLLGSWAQQGGGGGGLLGGGGQQQPSQQIAPGLPGGAVPKGVRYKPDGTPELYY